MNFNHKHAVVIVPGLGDEVGPLKLSVRNWPKKYGLTPVICVMHWKRLDENFEVKFKRLLNVFDYTASRYKRVSLLGYSAGGSAVVSAFIERKKKAYKVVSVCGRLEKGRNVTPSLEEASKLSPAFSQSVRDVEERLVDLSATDKKKILTITSRYGDNIVPISTAMVTGVVNKTVPIFGHIPSIVFAFIFPQQIIDFLTRDD